MPFNLCVFSTLYFILVFSSHLSVLAKFKKKFFFFLQKPFCYTFAIHIHIFNFTIHMSKILQITLLVHQIVREIRFTVMSNLKYNTVFGLSDSNNVCSAFSAVYCKTSFPFRFDFRYQCNYR